MRRPPEPTGVIYINTVDVTHHSSSGVPKTVETHIRNIFRKLDAGSRVEVARMVERADRLAASGA